MCSCIFPCWGCANVDVLNLFGLLDSNVFYWYHLQKDEQEHPNIRWMEGIIMTTTAVIFFMESCDRGYLSLSMAYHEELAHTS
jgi:hypothetical protein